MDKTGHTRKRRVAALILTVAFTATLAVPLAGSAMGAGVVVSFNVRPSLGASLTENGLTVHSSAPWVLTTTSTQSGTATDTAVVEGAATGREGVTVPVDGLVGYSLVSDR